MSKPAVAYLADGQLMLAMPGQPPRPVESAFVEGILERRAEHRKRHGWRSSGMMWNFNQVEGAEAPQAELPDTSDLPARFLSVVEGENPGEVYYTLQTDMIGGLFLLDLKENYERRLAHKQDLRLKDLARHPADGRLACTMVHADGSSSLGLMNGEGSNLREVTAGDSVDESPSWVPNREATLVYQSAGIGRDANGAIYGLSPYGVYELDLENDRMTPLLGLEDFDCLSPRVTADGALYYIRRPYEIRPAVSALGIGKDIVLFPFRLVRAFVHFLNAFSVFFSRKPLLTAGGPKRKGPDRRALMLWGRWVQMDKALRDGSGADRPLVPRTWQLVRRDTTGEEETIASSVVAFDLCADGGLIYTNGTSVYHRANGAGDGRDERLARGRFIEHVRGVSV